MIGPIEIKLDQAGAFIEMVTKNISYVRGQIEITHAGPTATALVMGFGITVDPNGSQFYEADSSNRLSVITTRAASVVVDVRATAKVRFFVVTASSVSGLRGMAWLHPYSEYTKLE